MKRIKNLLAILLVLTLVFPITAFAADDQLAESEQAPIFWIQDEGKFATLFNLAANEESQSIAKPADANAATQSLTLAAIENTTSYNATYTFDVDGEGTAAPVTVSGVMDTYNYDDTFSVCLGTLKGTKAINGTMCKVSAVVQKEANGEAMNAGITIIPETATELSDYIFFGIGEEVISAEMIPDWILENSANNEPNTQSEESLMGIASYNYLEAFATGFNSGFSIQGLAQWTEFYYDSSIKRASVGTESFTENVDAYFSPGGYSGTIVSQLEIGLKTTSSSIPYIVNIHDIPASANGGGDFIDTSYVSYLTGLLSDVFDIAQSWLAPFEILMDSLADNDVLTVDVYPSGTNSNVEFNYSTNPFYMQDVNFDNAPMPVSFNLDTSISGYSPFTAYSSIEYYTTYIPTGSSWPVYLSIDGGSGESNAYSLYVRS